MKAAHRPLPALAALLLALLWPSLGAANQPCLNLRFLGGARPLWSGGALPQNGLIGWWDSTGGALEPWLEDESGRTIALERVDRVDLGGASLEFARPAEALTPFAVYHLLGFYDEWGDGTPAFSARDTAAVPPGALPRLLRTHSTSDVHPELSPCSPGDASFTLSLEHDTPDTPLVLLRKAGEALPFGFGIGDATGGLDPGHTENLELAVIGREGSFLGWSEPFAVFQAPTGCSHQSERNETLVLSALALVWGMGRRRRG